MHKRSFRNYLIEPNLQLKAPLIFVAFIGLMGFFSNFFIVQVFTFLVDNLVSQGDLAVSATDVTDRSMNSIITISLIFWTCTAVVMTIALIIVTHRIAGAEFAIVKYIRTYIDGKEQSSPLTLRKGDYLKSVTSAVNDLVKVKS